VRIGASDELAEQLFRGDGVLASEESGAAKGFQVDQYSGLGVEDGDGVGREIPSVVGLRAGKVPVVADPRERLGVADVEGMADQRGTGHGGGSEEKGREKYNRYFLDGRFHVLAPCELLGVQWGDALGCVSVNGRAEKIVSHLRRSWRSHDAFPALTGWASFWRAYGTEARPERNSQGDFLRRSCFFRSCCWGAGVA